MGNFYTVALLELFLHCYTLGEKHLSRYPWTILPGPIFFTLALLVLLVTNIMSGWLSLWQRQGPCEKIIRERESNQHGAFSLLSHLSFISRLLLSLRFVLSKNVKIGYFVSRNIRYGLFRESLYIRAVNQISLSYFLLWADSAFSGTLDADLTKSLKSMVFFLMHVAKSSAVVPFGHFHL